MIAISRMHLCSFLYVICNLVLCVFHTLYIRNTLGKLGCCPVNEVRSTICHDSMILHRWNNSFDRLICSLKPSRSIGTIDDDRCIPDAWNETNLQHLIFNRDTCCYMPSKAPTLRHLQLCWGIQIQKQRL